MTISLGNDLQKSLGKSEDWIVLLCTDLLYLHIYIFTYIFIGFINPLENVGDWKFEAHNLTEIPDWSSLEEEIKDDIETSEKKSLVWILGTGSIILIAVCGSLLLVWRLIKHYKRDSDIKENLRQDIEMAVRKINTEY